MAKKFFNFFIQVTTALSTKHERHCVLAHVIGSSNANSKNRKLIAIAYNDKRLGDAGAIQHTSSINNLKFN